MHNLGAEQFLNDCGLNAAISVASVLAAPLLVKDFGLSFSQSVTLTSLRESAALARRPARPIRRGALPNFLLRG
jgi:hypothetical protein